MTDDDTCTDTLNSGDPCTYTAKYDDGKCGIHTDERGDSPQNGRETTFTESLGDDCIEAAKEGKSVRGCARAAGVNESTLRSWLDRHDGFSRSFARARAQGESELIHGGLRDDEVDSSMAKFLLASSFDYKKTEKQELEHSSDGFEFNITYDDGDD